MSFKCLTRLTAIRIPDDDRLVPTAGSQGSAVGRPGYVQDAFGLGAEGFVVGSSLLGILAQRLLRRICDRCRETAPLDARQQTWLEAMVGPHARRLDFKRGAGCPRCNNTGYYGRVGVFELLRIDTPLADALRNDDSAGFIRIALNQRGFKPLPMAAFE